VLEEVGNGLRPGRTHSNGDNEERIENACSYGEPMSDHHHGQRTLLPSRAPAARLSNLAQTISVSISGGLERLDAKPQSVEAMTRSRPTTFASRTIRSATTSGCSIITAAW